MKNGPFTFDIMLNIEAEREEDIHTNFDEEYAPQGSPIIPQSLLDSSYDSKAPEIYHSLADIYKESDELMFLQDDKELSQLQVKVKFEWKP